MAFSLSSDHLRSLVFRTYVSDFEPRAPTGTRQHPLRQQQAFQLHDRILRVGAVSRRGLPRRELGAERFTRSDSLISSVWGLRSAPLPACSCLSDFVGSARGAGVGPLAAKARTRTKSTYGAAPPPSPLPNRLDLFSPPWFRVCKPLLTFFSPSPTRTRHHISEPHHSTHGTCSSLFEPTPIAVIPHRLTWRVRDFCTGTATAAPSCCKRQSGCTGAPSGYDRLTPSDDRCSCPTGASRGSLRFDDWPVSHLTDSHSASTSPAASRPFRLVFLVEHVERTRQRHQGVA